MRVIKSCVHGPIAAASFGCARPADSSACWILTAVLGTFALGEIVVPSAAAADIPAIAHRQRTEKKIFTDSEIIEGFLKIAFGAEYHLAGRVDRIRKYEAPVRVFADGARADRKAQIAKIVTDIAARVQTSRHRHDRRQ